MYSYPASTDHVFLSREYRSCIPIPRAPIIYSYPTAVDSQYEKAPRADQAFPLSLNPRRAAEVRPGEKGIGKAQRVSAERFQRVGSASCQKRLLSESDSFSFLEFWKK